MSDIYLRYYFLTALIYIVSAGPMTFYCMLFISKCIKSNKEIFEYRSNREERKALDTIREGVWQLDAVPLCIQGWRTFPPAVIIVSMVLYWYVKNSIAMNFMSSDHQ